MRCGRPHASAQVQEELGKFKAMKAGTKPFIPEEQD
jgi:hypothetical protein